MNFNLYLDREAAAQLTRLAKIKRTPRNALIREAVRDWLDRAAKQWPAEVLAYKGNANVLPFEAHRNELSASVDDPFGEAPGRRSVSTKSRTRRVRRK